MKHLILCPEYPPAPIPLGGIGTYVTHISKLLAESGETVHVIGQLWKGAERRIEEKCHGRLIIHRVRLDGGKSFSGRKLSSARKAGAEEGLLASSFPPQYFSWQASLLAESLIEQEGIDLIEAQDYEAPLYYLQLRRALGLGPKRRPPCIIHLHSPTEIIIRYNDWDIGRPYLMTAKRLEDYSIASADALLCPSRYLARQATTHYGLNEGCIQVIPLPIGNIPMLERDKDIWEHGTICYVGRLERRKGVIEWIDAAVDAAPAYPSARFEFIGANILGTDTLRGEKVVEHRIPDELKSRFHFRGQQNHSTLLQFLAGARIAVVPSRWENFPNTCVEAMSSGLPVIASREGGMVEMIEDGRTGWLADKAGSVGLRDALRRALGTPSGHLAKMGREASMSIRQMCDNKKVLESHLNFRRLIVNQGAKRSLHLPVNLSWTKRAVFDESPRRTTQNKCEKGIAIVVTCFNTGQFLDSSLQSIRQQTQQPAAVIVVDDKSTEGQTLKALRKSQQDGWQIIQKKNGDLVPAKNTGIETILRSEPNILGFAFLNAGDQLQPGFVATCESVLQHCSEVGLVSCWAHYSGIKNDLWIRPCPGFPYQWLTNEAVPFSIVRAEALREAGNFRIIMSHGYDNWDLFNAVMAAGWIAVTIPAILGDHRVVEDSALLMARVPAFGKMRREILERFPDLIARDAKDIVFLIESSITQSLCEELFTLRRERTTARTMLSTSRQSVVRILKKLKKRVLQRTPVWMSNFISRITAQSERVGKEIR
ncbi:MAG: hypothetical protein B6D35_01430 [Candidatus Brocadia sp. UTAMX2]|jgi:glycosyltransferase involved in cell wall biosynthesis|nr:MAG: hypothetical protein B6D35_01430 [Candidatus Brocadia sp. UTAMX2]